MKLVGRAPETTWSQERALWQSVDGSWWEISREPMPTLDGILVIVTTVHANAVRETADDLPTVDMLGLIPIGNRSACVQFRSFSTIEEANAHWEQLVAEPWAHFLALVL